MYFTRTRISISVVGNVRSLTHSHTLTHAPDWLRMYSELTYTQFQLRSPILGYGMWIGLKLRGGEILWPDIAMEDFWKISYFFPLKVEISTEVQNQHATYNYEEWEAGLPIDGIFGGILRSLKNCEKFWENFHSERDFSRKRTFYFFQNKKIPKSKNLFFSKNSS